MTKLAAMTFLLCFVGSSFAADGWFHVRLNAANDMKISVDFKKEIYTNNVDGPSKLVTACPIFVNVYYPGLKNSDQIKIVLQNKRQYLETDYSEATQYFLDLKYQGDHFSGELGHSFRTADYKDVYIPCIEIDHQGPYQVRSYIQELSVSINGIWLVDPLSRTNNFKFEMAQTAD